MLEIGMLGSTWRGLETGSSEHRASPRPYVRPAKAGMFSGRQSHRGKSQNPVAWVASVEETNRMKPTDKAIVRMVSELPGRNASEPIDGLETP